MKPLNSCRTVRRRHHTWRLVVLLVLIFQFSSKGSAQIRHLVRPSDTDAAITSHNSNHYVFVDPEVPVKNELVVFLPGTGGIPFFYQLFLEEAARFGYHAIGLTYPNDRAINGLSICGLSTDTSCHRLARHEIFDGVDRHAGVDVNVANSIQNRLIKLLLHLDGTFPNEGWGQYISEDTIRWSSVKLAGHSQGGGHAAFIGKIRVVERVIVVASNDRIGLLNRSADWVTMNGSTDSRRYFALMHPMDELVDYDNAQVFWSDLSLFDHGSIVLVDSTEAPYQYSRTLITETTPDGNGQGFHNAPVVDNATPKDDFGDPVLAPAWQYMLSVDIDRTLASQTVYAHRTELKMWPNPATDVIHIDVFGHEASHWSIRIYDINGTLQQSVEWQLDAELCIHRLESGFYYLVAIGENGLVRGGRFLKY